MPPNGSSGLSKNEKLLPILIIPGFMSSGLEIRKSTRRPGWQNKRVWLNLASLGFEAMQLGKAVEEHKPTDDFITCKSDWLTHMSLTKDMRTEREGIQVRPIEGLKGVDYLAPGAIMNLVSYVFGPVIRVLLNAGYNEGENLNAAPYDWRLPPSELERRDGYFTNVTKIVEDLYNKNNQTPVVLICHSLGCKVGHYWLNFCERHKGREWIDQHIHCYMPVGGAHLGAPISIRSVIVGDKMSLDTFLSDEEALALGRTLGSGPWLFPKQLPQGAPSNSFVRPQGCLEMTATGSSVDVAYLTKCRLLCSVPDKFRLAIIFGDAAVTTDYREPDTGGKSGTVHFPDIFLFATAAEAATPERASDDFQVLLLEPISRTIPLCCPFRVLETLVDETAVLKGGRLSRLFSGSAVLAASRHMKMSDFVSESKPAATIDVDLFHRTDRNKGPMWWCYRSKTANITFRIKWTAPVPVDTISESKPQITVRHPSTEDPKVADGYMGCSDMLEREGLRNMLNIIHDVYEADPLDPLGYSSSDAPPVKRVKAIYGINVPSEAGAVFRRRSGIVKRVTRSNYRLDKSAKLLEGPDAIGFELKGGILLETSTPTRSSGDGAVPYYSLNHVQSWNDSCQVEIDEIDKAEHRAILADERFHKILLDYVRGCQ